jgi:hypothetical protein
MKKMHDKNKETKKLWGEGGEYLMRTTFRKKIWYLKLKSSDISFLEEKAVKEKQENKEKIMK